MSRVDEARAAALRDLATKLYWLATDFHDGLISLDEVRSRMAQLSKDADAMAVYPGGAGGQIWVER